MTTTSSGCHSAVWGVLHWGQMTSPALVTSFFHSLFPLSSTPGAWEQGCDIWSVFSNEYLLLDTGYFCCEGEASSDSSSLATVLSRPPERHGTGRLDLTALDSGWRTGVSRSFTSSLLLVHSLLFIPWSLCYSVSACSLSPVFLFSA